MKQFFRFIHLLIIIFLIGTASVRAQYCLPTYTYGCLDGDGLTLLQLNTINQTITLFGVAVMVS